MKFLSVSKDGGAESTVWAYWLFEIKSLCSVVLLRFEPGSRDAYHEHAFDCVSWVLRGKLQETTLLENRREHDGIGPFFGNITREHTPSLVPVVTRRETFHKVVSVGRTWVLSFRGPWKDTWREYLPTTRELRTLTHGRKEVPS